jgi:hemerythrin
MLAEWNDSFSLGNATIDDQHKILFGLINKLNQGIMEKQGRQILDWALDEVVEYTMTHFKTEEDLMRDHGYPALAEHKGQHDAMAAKLAEFRKRYETGQEDLSMEVLMVLIDWLHEHLGASDSKLKPYLCDKGVR